MPHLRWPLLPAALASAVVFGSVRSSRAEDPPPAPAPAPAPTPAPVPNGEREKALRRAEELDQQVEALYGRGEYEEATTIARESLALREQALGKDHPEVATSVHNLAWLLRTQGAYDTARPLFERALAIREKALGPDHPQVATSLNHLALLLFDEGAYAEARPLLERALAIREKALGPDHPDFAQSLNNLAELHRVQGANAEARPLLERALAIREKALGKDDLAVAMSLNNLALLLYDQWDYAGAQSYYERALAIREKALGGEHAVVADTLDGLAGLQHVRGADREARALFERALAIREKVLGKEHPHVALSLSNLAKLLRDQGAYAEARPLCERALAIVESALGKEHPHVALCLSELAVLLQMQGAYAEARPLHARALAIREHVLGKDHPDVAGSLNDLAVVLMDQGEPAEAKPLLERALAIYERVLGKDDAEASATLVNLAEVLRAQGADDEARALCERALASDERALGPDHPDVASSLNNLAVLLQSQGHLPEARRLLERALAIRSKSLGQDHPATAVCLGNLADLLRAQGAYAEARPIYERALVAVAAEVRTEVAALSASQRLARLRSVRVTLDAWLRFAPEVGLTGHAEALAFRGIVARAEAAERTLVRRATDEQRAGLEALEAATRLTARLANGVPSSGGPEALGAWQARYAQAAAERERRSREVTARVAPARAALERLDLTEADVQRSLAPGTALVDLLRVGDHYLAWVLRSTGAAARVELGPAETLEAAAQAFLAALRGTSGQERGVALEPEAASGAGDLKRAGDALASLLWAPLAASLGDGVERVVICPDAALASIPFAALPGRGPGKALLDELSIRYVFHPFDLVAPKEAAPAGTGAVLVGGVDFARAEGGAPGTPDAGRPPVLASLDRAPRGEVFQRLPGTLAEALALEDMLGKDRCTLLQGAQATEARLRDAAKGKRFVHLATHGFSRDDLFAGLYERGIERAFLSAAAERQLGAGHDPMLLSGLALAGANPRDGAGGDDGILTALEASYLDLDGVDLVTLSACETAKGTPESGEGVLGLVSAFQMAGARNVLASLWKVDDEATRLLMEGVYERLLQKDHPLSPAEALRESALALRAQKDPATGQTRFAAPRYWAAFVAYGR